MHKALTFIADNLSDHNITWGVGGSLLLSFYELINHPNDIDILVEERHAAKLNEVMLSISQPKEALKSDPFRTIHFSKYIVNDISIDVMGGFAIQHEEGIYKLSLTEDSIVNYKKINGVDIPLCSLEDWYVLYWLIPSKEEKALLIEKYLRASGVAHPQLLIEALKQPLPHRVRERIINVLN